MADSRCCLSLGVQCHPVRTFASKPPEGDIAAPTYVCCVRIALLSLNVGREKPLSAELAHAQAIPIRRCMASIRSGRWRKLRCGRLLTLFRSRPTVSPEPAGLSRTATSYRYCRSRRWHASGCLQQNGRRWNRSSLHRRPNTPRKTGLAGTDRVAVGWTGSAR